jgi:hypothetical protein
MVERTPLPFENVLEVLGALKTEPVETTQRWAFFNVQYPTPAGLKPASYLALTHDCPLQEATKANIARWKGLSGKNGPYTVVVTQKSRLANDLARTEAEFKGHATTPRDLLFNNVLSSLMPSREQIEEPQCFFGQWGSSSCIELLS